MAGERVHGPERDPEPLRAVVLAVPGQRARDHASEAHRVPLEVGVVDPERLEAAVAGGATPAHDVIDVAASRQAEADGAGEGSHRGGSSGSAGRPDRTPLRPHLLLHGSGLFGAATGRTRPGRRRRGPCDNPAMSIDRRFDELAGSLGGFYTSWAAYLGLELGLFERIREAGPGGIPPDELALASRCLVRAGRRLGPAGRRGRARRVRRQARPGDRRGDDDPPRQRASRVPRRPVRVDRREQPRLRASRRVLPDRPDDPRAAAAVPSGDRGGHGPGHRRLLPGGARGAARARGGARRRRARARRRLRRAAGGSSRSPVASRRRRSSASNSSPTRSAGRCAT